MTDAVVVLLVVGITSMISISLGAFALVSRRSS